MKDKKKILIAEDSDTVRNMYTDYLTREGYDVKGVTTGSEAIEAFKYFLPLDLIILDIRMPFMDGFEALKELRKVTDIPIIMLTANDGDEEEIKSLDLGATDFVSKTRSLKSLSKRIEMLIERNEPELRERTFGDGAIYIDYIAKELYVDGIKKDVNLTEFTLLELLTRDPGKVLTKEDAYKGIWGESDERIKKYLDNELVPLRKALAPYKPIKNKRGYGHYFEFDEKE